MSIRLTCLKLLQYSWSRDMEAVQWLECGVTSDPSLDPAIRRKSLKIVLVECGIRIQFNQNLPEIVISSDQPL